MTHVSLFRPRAACTLVTCVIKPNPEQHFSSPMIIPTMISLSSYNTLTRYGGTARSGWHAPRGTIEKRAIDHGYTVTGHKAPRYRPQERDRADRGNLGVRDLHHRLRLAVRIVLRRGRDRRRRHHRLDHRRHRHHHPGAGARRAWRHVSGGRRHGAVPAPGVRAGGGHLVRLLLIPAGGHGRADRGLRGDPLRVLLVARDLQPDGE